MVLRDFFISRPPVPLVRVLVVLLLLLTGLSPAQRLGETYAADDILSESD